MTSEELKLLSDIRSKCMSNPEFLNVIIGAATEGVIAKERAARHMASDMEVVASAMASLVSENRVSPKLKAELNNLALTKLQTYYGKSFLRWDNLISTTKKSNLRTQK
jgi:hypothetical protein